MTNDRLILINKKNDMYRNWKSTIIIPHNYIMGNTNCWMEVFQLKNALLNYREKLLIFSESILSTRAPPLSITSKHTKEIYNLVCIY